MWNYDCVELDTSAVPLLSGATAPAAEAGHTKAQRPSLGLYAPGTTAEQRHLGLLAALATFDAAGLSPSAACTAPGHTGRERPGTDPSPAQTRAIAIWKWATRAAQAACYSNALAPDEARLFMSSESARPAEPHAWTRQAIPANGDRAGRWERPAGQAAVHPALAAPLRHDDVLDFSFPFGRERGIQMEEMR